MQQNDISIVITQAQEDAIMAKADELRALLAPFLTDEERSSLFKLGDARLAFDTKASDYIHSRPNLVPDSSTLPSTTRTAPRGAPSTASPPKSAPSSAN